MKERECQQFSSQISEFEGLKSERLNELSMMMQTSLERFNSIRKEKQIAIEKFEEEQTNLITHKKKAIRYEEIRLKEETEQLKQEQEVLDAEQADIDEKVIGDCPDEHAAKHKLNQQIDSIQDEIVALQKQIELLGQKKNALELECSIHQKVIDQVKIDKFKDRIEKNQKLRSKLDVKLRDNVKDQAKLDEDTTILQNMQVNLEKELSTMNTEPEKLAQMENHFEIQSNKLEGKQRVKSMLASLLKDNEMQLQSLSNEVEKQTTPMKFLKTRLDQLESQIGEMESTQQKDEGLKVKMEAEKKKFAADKKFKEAKKCQADVKALAEKLEASKLAIEQQRQYMNQVQQDWIDYKAKADEIQAQEEKAKSELEKVQLVSDICRKYEVQDYCSVVSKIIQEGKGDCNELTMKLELLRGEYQVLEDRIGQV